MNLMNKDQVNGAVKVLAGKVQEEAGKLVASKEQQIKGKSKKFVEMLSKNTAMQKKPKRINILEARYNKSGC